MRVLGWLVLGWCLGCTPFDRLGEEAKCRLRGCDAGPAPVDAGDASVSFDAGADAGPAWLAGCDRPELLDYVARVRAEWNCVRAALLWSADGGFSTPAPPERVEMQQPVFQGFASTILLPDERVLGFPVFEKLLLFVNPDGGTEQRPFSASRELNYDSGTSLPRAPVASGVLASDGVVYLCPGEDPLFVRLEVPFDGGFGINELDSTVLRPALGALLDDGGFGWSGCVSAPGFGVYAIPRFGRYLLELRLDGGQVNVIDLWKLQHTPRAGEEFFGAALASTGEVVAIPSVGETARFLTWAPTTRSLRSIDSTLLAAIPDSGTDVFLRSSVILGDGTIVALPSTSLAPAGLSAGLNPGPATLPDGQGALSRPAFGGVLSDERVFFSSFSEFVPPRTLGSDGGLDVWNSRTGEFSTLPLPAGFDVSGFAGGVSRPDGTLVMIPRKGRHLLLLPTGTNRPLPLGVRLSPFINHF
jgi:hypothetical protein